jgi:hypothetical protein
MKTENRSLTARPAARGVDPIAAICGLLLRRLYVPLQGIKNRPTPGGNVELRGGRE